MTHNWFDVVDKGQIVGRIKLEYRYLLSLPVVMLYTAININNKTEHREQLLVHADRHLQ